MAGEPLDTLEIKISSTSDTAVKHVEALASSLERLDKASQIEGLENIVKKLQALGNVNQTISVTVDSSSVQAVDSLIERVGVLQRAIEQVNATPIRVSGLSSRTATTRANTAQSANNAEAFDTSAIEVESQAVDKVTSRVAALRRSISGIGEGITRYMNSPLVAGASLWTAIGSKATSELSKVQKIAGETSLKIRNIFSSAGAIVNKTFQPIANTIKNTIVPATEYVRGKLNQLGSSAQKAFAKIKESAAVQATFRTISQPIALLAGTLRTVIPAAAGLAEKAFEKLGSSISKVKNLLSGLGGIAKQFGNLLKKALDGALWLAGKLFSGFKKIASTIAGGLVGGVKKLASGLKSIGGHVLNYVTKPFQRAIGFIENFKKKLVSVAFYRLVRTALKMITDGFKEGIENLYYFSSLTESQFKPAMDSLASSSLYLKNSLGAMAAPLIQAVAPAVNYLIDLFVSLLNVINMVFSVLGGRTYTKALKTSAKYADDLDKSLGGGASSAKELQRYLIGIDQLTIIPDQPNSGGGGGGGTDLGAQYEEMFEEVPLPDWVLNIKKAINAGKWEQAGKLLAKKVNGLIDTLKKNAPAWGNKIGQAIQHGIELGLGFIRDLDIEGFAASLTTIVGNAMNKVNPRDLGAIVASKIKSAFRFVHGLLEGYTGPDIGAYLAEVVNGWFAELRRDNGWKQAAEDLSNIIKGIIDGVASFLENLDTASIEQDLRDFFGNIDWDGIWSSLENLAEVAGNKIPWKDMFNGLLGVAANALVFVHDTILKIPSTQATSGVWGTLISKIKDGQPISFMDVLSGLSAFFGDVVDYITDMIPESGWGGIWDTIKENLAGALTNGGSWDDLKKQLKGVLVKVIGGALEIAADSLYSAISESHPWIAGWLFPGAKNKAYNNAMSGSSSSKLGYLLKNNPAAGLLVPGADDILAGLGGGGKTNGAGAGRKVTIDFDATETKAYKNATSLYREIGDKKSRMDLSARNKTPSVFSEGRQNWSTLSTKTATLSAMAKNVSSGVFLGLTSIWKSLNNKTATITGQGVQAQSLTDLNGLYGRLNDKSATVTGRGSQDKSLTNVKSAFDSVYNKSATLSAYANNKNPSTLSSLQSAWQIIVSKSVSLSVAVASSVAGALAGRRATGGIFAGGAWHDIAGYAGGGNPKRARLFYANENGIPELVGSIGGNTAVMNNGQIVASVSSGVYRAVSAAMGGIGNYFANIATSMSHIPEVLSSIVPVQPQPIMVGASGPSYEMDMSVIGRTGYDGMVQRGQEDQEEIINAIYAMGQRIISAINSKDTNLYFDTQRVGSSTTDVQNRQNRMYGKTLSNG